MALEIEGSNPSVHPILSFFWRSQHDQRNAKPGRQARRRGYAVRPLGASTRTAIPALRPDPRDRACCTVRDIHRAHGPRSLDTRSSREVLGLLRTAAREYGQTIVMVSHDPVAASYADRVLVLADGRLVGDHPAMTAQQIAELLIGLELGAA